jgi:lysozyme
MTPSKQCADFIKGFEACRLKAYMPTPKDVPTIGWGSTGPDIHMGMTWTQEQADARFAADLARFGATVAGLLSGAPATTYQYDAMVSLAYNIGVDGFRQSTVRRLHNAGDYHGAAEAFALWSKQAGKTLNGLVRRRAAEAAMYRGSNHA